MRSLKQFRPFCLAPVLSSVNKSVRSDVQTHGNRLQEEAVITAVQRRADLSPIAFSRWKNLLFCTGTNPECFTFFSPQDGKSTKCLFWTENVELFHSSRPLYEFSKSCSYWSLLLQEQLQVAILAAGGQLRLCNVALIPVNSPLITVMASQVKL